MTADGPLLLTASEVASRLRTTPDAVRRWCRDGKLILFTEPDTPGAVEEPDGSWLFRAFTLPSGEWRIHEPIVDAIARGLFHPDRPRRPFSGGAAA